MQAGSRDFKIHLLHVNPISLAIGFGKKDLLVRIVSRLNVYFITNVWMPSGYDLTIGKRVATHEFVGTLYQFHLFFRIGAAGIAAVMEAACDCQNNDYYNKQCAVNLKFFVHN
jgi:hypothetical protein